MCDSAQESVERDEKLESCGVTDGCTIQVTSRMRGGGRHKDKKSKGEKKQVTRQEPLKSEGPTILESDKDAVSENRGGSDIEVERKMQHWAKALQARAGVDKGHMRVMECGLRWAVEARRRGRREEEEQRRLAEQRQNIGQEQSKQGKQVRFGDKEQLEGDVQRQSYGQIEEVQASSEGEMRGGKGKGDGRKGEHEGKEDEDREQDKEKETRQETRQEELMSEKPPGVEEEEERRAQGGARGAEESADGER